MIDKIKDLIANFKTNNFKVLDNWTGADLDRSIKIVVEIANVDHSSNLISFDYKIDINYYSTNIGDAYYSDLEKMLAIIGKADITIEGYEEEDDDSNLRTTTFKCSYNWWNSGFEWIYRYNYK